MAVNGVDIVKVTYMPIVTLDVTRIKSIVALDKYIWRQINYRGTVCVIYAFIQIEFCPFNYHCVTDFLSLMQFFEPQNKCMLV